MSARRRIPPAQARHYLREWREYRDLDQDRAADRIGLSRSYLSKIENGKKEYKQSILEAAAEAYGCTVRDILERNPFAEGEVVDLTERLRNLPSEKRRQIEDVIAALLKSG